MFAAYVWALAAVVSLSPLRAAIAGDWWTAARSRRGRPDARRVPQGDFWGRLEGGLTVLTAEGVAVRGSASWDGVGASDYSGYTLQGTVTCR